MSIADELEKLEELFRRGALSFHEFESLKGKVLDLADDADNIVDLNKIKVSNDGAAQLESLDTSSFSQLSENEGSAIDLSGLDEPQVANTVSEFDLDTNSFSHFEKIEIAGEVPISDPKRNLVSDDLSQLGKSELINKVAEMDQKLETLKVQNDVAEVDRLWELEKKSYESVDEHGRRSLPSKEGSILAGIAITGFGIFATSAFGPFGLILILVGIGISVLNYRQATKYERAKKRYNRRRISVRKKR